MPLLVTAGGGQCLYHSSPGIVTVSGGRCLYHPSPCMVTVGGMVVDVSIIPTMDGHCQWWSMSLSFFTFISHYRW